MLFDSSIRKELARSFGATLVVLVTVVMTMILIRTLGQASRGSVNPSEIVLVMSFTVLGQLPIILSLSLFIAIVGSLSRMYRDSEMVVWFASGQGLMRFLSPLVRFSWPIVLGVALLSLVIWPWANGQIQTLKTRYEQRSDLDRVAPGQFQESASGNRVFFIDKDSPDSTSASNIFIAAADGKKESVTSAQSAKMEIQDGERMLLLNQGQRLDTTQGVPGLKISSFQEYGARIGDITSAAPGETIAKTMPTHKLWGQDQPTYQAELSWRIGLTLAAFNFVLWGLAVASVNPRAGRSTSLVFALFAFIIYYNLMSVGQSWVNANRLPMPTLLIALHGGSFLLALLIIAARHNHWSLPRWPYHQK